MGGGMEWEEKYYTEVTQLEPDNPTAYVRLALINMAHANQEAGAEEKNKFYAEAIKFYGQAISKKSNLAPAYYGIAIAYEKLNNYDQAIEEVGKAVTLAVPKINNLFFFLRRAFKKK